ncbi:hypothetical protein PILCRDRAFT_828443 [Piloderma croceum F 1598]|uniref:Uncharacterized protein n=1 Tax=Piloderma croceum (strain F 1598) TaxID=765440 RepID=A0A0C3BA08_PILCF|nr:hypothetical protein PILCRDRAFT_828443 [Piloderma croceum F 1598]
MEPRKSRSCIDQTRAVFFIDIDGLDRKPPINIGLTCQQTSCFKTGKPGEHKDQITVDLDRLTTLRGEEHSKMAMTTG